MPELYNKCMGDMSLFETLLHLVKGEDMRRLIAAFENELAGPSTGDRRFYTNVD